MKIILLIGKICTGKSTYARTLPGTLLISCDQLMQSMFPGGCGEHRADRFICDYLRMANFQSLAGKVRVRTNDRDFRKKVKAYTGI